MLGPLGRGFECAPQGKRAVLVGGGAGVAPLAILQDRLEDDGAAGTPSVLLGFRDREHAEGAALLRDAQLATEDGSHGSARLVTELLAQALTAEGGVNVYACGPAGMLEAVRALCAERGVHAQLALETPMACGFGACYGCAVKKRGGGYLRLCVEGPVLDASVLERVEPHMGAPA